MESKSNTTGPKILVTGLGHSGTTYVTKMLAEATGLSYRPEECHDGNVRQGAEWFPLRNLVEQYIKPILHLPTEPTNSNWGMYNPECEVNLEPIRKVIKGFDDWPDIVKLPYTCWGSLLVDINPQVVIVVQRNMQAWADSMRQNPYVQDRMQTDGELIQNGYYQLGGMWYWINEWQNLTGRISHTTHYPDITGGKYEGVVWLSHALIGLGDLTTTGDLQRAIRKVSNPDYIMERSSSGTLPGTHWRHADD